MNDTSLLAPPMTTQPSAATSRAARSRGGRIARRVLTGLFLLLALLLAAIVVGPRFLPYEVMVVRSGSMSPTIPTGSIVIYHHEAASSIRVGQVIAFVEPGDSSVVVTHRVHQIVNGPNGRYFITKGDANAVPDAWRVPAAGVGWVASYHVPDIGYALSWLSTAWARIALITIPALGLGMLLLFEHRRPREEAEEALAS